MEVFFSLFSPFFSCSSFCCRDTFEDCEKLNPLGFKIGLELMVKCHPRKLSEVSIVFKDRVGNTMISAFAECADLSSPFSFSESI